MKRESVTLFELLLEMKLFLTHQTKRVFASGLHLSHFYKDMRLSSTCVTIIVTDSFDDLRDKKFSYLFISLVLQSIRKGLKRERVNILMRPT